MDKNSWLREGIRQTVYLDSAQKPTIGVGHLITKDELSTGTITINGSVRRKPGPGCK